MVVGGKVVLLLRTKEAKVAMERFPLALDAFCDTLGQPLHTLSRVLAGELYQDAVHELDHDDAFEACRDEGADAGERYRQSGRRDDR